MNKKLRKLVRSPRLFFKDMLIKRQAKSAPATTKVVGRHQYSVVSAVYNVGRYLDAYFESLVNQTLDFRQGIQLVMVDDGSTDDSAQVIQRWQARFPDNIVYVRKDNGGQASARNLGITHATHPWVTFIDPDDFVDKGYFLELDKFLHAHAKADVQMIACHLIFFFEESGQFKDTHPLRYRFQSGDKVFPFDRTERHLQMSASTALFRADVIRQCEIVFDDRVKPAFEDAHFVARYLAALGDGSVGFACKPKYYYRKRSDGSSTLDTSWQHPGRVGAVLEYGHLDMLRTHLRASGEIPAHVQRMSLYDIAWVVRHFMSQPDRHAHLDEAQIERAWTLLREVFRYIDASTVLDFELAGCWFLHKVAMLWAFKDTPPAYQIAYIEDIDPIKEQVLITYYGGEALADASIRINDREVFADHQTCVDHSFLGRRLVGEHRMWLHLPRDGRGLTVSIGDRPARLSLGGKQIGLHADLSSIYEHFRKSTPRRGQTTRFRDAWVLMDRPMQGDDNAEHLYRHLRDSRPDINLFFALDPGSHDWPRLEADGFRLLPFGSEEHKLALRSASKFISSHLDAFITDLLGEKQRRPYHFVFLQHGVVHNDLSHWFNSKKMDLMVTSAKAEAAAIAGPGGTYKFTDKEVVLTGLPRHDALRIRGAGNPGRDIVVMPTWRKSLVKVLSECSEADAMATLRESHYFRAWSAVLSDPRLLAQAQAQGGRVVFFPHASIRPFIDGMELPAHVEVKTVDQGLSIQEVFVSAAVLVTDYSSVAFDMAYLRRPVVYFQFDEAEFFGGGHIGTRGYFDYRRDGFGPFVTEPGQVAIAVQQCLTQPALRELLVRRADSFFPFNDARNCERVVRAIEALDAPYAADPARVAARVRVDLDQAIQRNRWTWAVDRAMQLSRLQGGLNEECRRKLAEILPAWWCSLGGASQREHAALAAELLCGLPDVRTSAPNAMRLELAPHLAERKDWTALAALMQPLAQPVGHAVEEASYWMALALRGQGQIEAAHQALWCVGYPPDTSASWHLASELAALLGRWPEAAHALRRGLTLNPAMSPPSGLEVLVKVDDLARNTTPEVSPSRWGRSELHLVDHAGLDA